MLTRLIDALLYPEYASRDKSQDITNPGYNITDRGTVILHEDALQERLSKSHKEIEAAFNRQAEENT